MARPREFEMETARQGAMDIFWKQGFQGTNLPDLLRAMGLTRGSFYKAFTDKQSAYLLALETYEQEVVDATVAMLDRAEAETAWDCLAPLFAGGQPERGCFICNAMVELGPLNPEVAARSNRMAGRIRDAIAGVLRHYPTGVAPADVAPLADVILHLYFGHQAMGKSGMEQSGDWSARLRALIGEARRA